MKNKSKKETSLCDGKGVVREYAEIDKQGMPFLDSLITYTCPGCQKCKKEEELKKFCKKIDNNA